MGLLYTIRFPTELNVGEISAQVFWNLFSTDLHEILNGKIIHSNKIRFSYKHLMIKRSKKNWTQCLDVSMSSFSGEKRIKFDN